MKNVIYYSSLTILWVIFLVVAGEILIATGGIQGPFPTHYYALAVTLLQPRLWLISAGIAMLFRPFVYKLSFGLKKSFNKSISIFLIMLGAIGVALNIGADYVIKKDVYNAKGSAVDHIRKATEEDVAFEKVKNDVEVLLITLCKDMNRQLPVRVDNMTTLNSAVYNNWVLTFHYNVKVDVNNFTDEEIEAIMDEMRWGQQIQLQDLFTKGEYGFTQMEFREFCKRTGLKIRLCYTDMNNSVLGVNVFDYWDF